MFDASIVSAKYPGRASRCVVSGVAMPRRHSASRSRGSISQRDAQSTAKRIPTAVSGSVNAPGRALNGPMDGDSISRPETSPPRNALQWSILQHARDKAPARASTLTSVEFSQTPAM